MLGKIYYLFLRWNSVKRIFENEAAPLLPK